MSYSKLVYRHCKTCNRRTMHLVYWDDGTHKQCIVCDTKELDD